MCGPSLYSGEHYGIEEPEKDIIEIIFKFWGGCLCELFLFCLFVSHLILNMFQCHSPISSRPRPLPQSPKDCSIHLCLFCCFTYRVIIAFFLNSIYKRSVHFSCSVVSNSLRPHESQHARPPCPSPTPGVHPDSRPSSQWCHPAISSSGVPSPPAPNPSQHQTLFQWVNSSHEVAKVLEFQL